MYMCCQRCHGRRGSRASKRQGWKRAEDILVQRVVVALHVVRDLPAMTAVKPSFSIREEEQNKRLEKAKATWKMGRNSQRATQADWCTRQLHAAIAHVQPKPRVFKCGGVRYRRAENGAARGRRDGDACHGGEASGLDDYREGGCGDAVRSTNGTW